MIIDSPACHVRQRGRLVVSVLITMILITMIMVTPAGGILARADEEPLTEISVISPFFSVRRKAEIPALERGDLLRIAASPGDLVSEGQELGSLDDSEASLAVEVARLELQAAEGRLSESRAVEIAEAELKEGERLLDQSKDEAEIAARIAADDSAVLIARKEHELAADEVERARLSRAASQISIGDKEWFRLRNELEQRKIAMEKATSDQAVAATRSRSRKSMVQQQETAVSRLKLQLLQARSDSELQKLEVENLRKVLQMAQLRRDRRSIRAPFDGMIVEQQKHKGEWVESGEPVFRLIGLDVLNVEGFINAADAFHLQRGCKVRVAGVLEGDTREQTGTLVFVSPEVDSNAQVLVRAEIPNPGQQFRPGDRAAMWILLSGAGAGVPREPVTSQK
ncbi:MAG: HlyD family efflux transporter periplasmic adaptor subunit [Planctomycetaceae bacterium]|nr:HlyD family efflux transporter periplasmic adaptor subunit [Planctomycetaceae bacterium]